MKLIVGLGNPGKKYERTRHNLGFLVVDRLADEKGIALNKRKYDCLIGDWQIDQERVLLVKPQTFMNHSGTAVKNLLRFLPVTAEDLVVIHDDLDLPLGRIRIRPRGGAGGHRGILSILEALGEESFYRIRMGIGRPQPGIDPTEFVLAPFSGEETALLSQIVSRGSAAVECLLQDGPHRAMEKFNRAK